MKLLFWTVGNELDYIPGRQSHHPRLWERLNELAISIKGLDSKHPVLTVVGTGRFKQKVKQIAAACQDIELLGINTDGDIASLSPSSTTKATPLMGTYRSSARRIEVVAAWR